jgi:calcineurin-like phosphoesterase family protein
MTNTFFISDTHFGHKNIVNFTHNDKPLRPFASAEEMDEALVENWNRVVGDKDTVYHLGDVAINRKALPIMDRLNGRKVLIKGNHDIFKLKDYVKYFDDIRAYKVMPARGIICSHIPIHPDSLSRWKVNIHGHLHAHRVMIEMDDGEILTHGKYISVCVEQINYTPIAFDEILGMIK